ncbi:hypothetical protein Z517_03000 [Fonsecaea pedrosoi CBS 271.37]|uniref:Unplaced genomic scaffold supercont1.2, whole genome shotgun sequence n=1 Tax=Fonsecaea pedrosoi CBS 271.37 TaxID=1442368 RepID=A0A0D2HH19_9EURO|nr:uncharacterized protein Z517_03000 [Fonsecaea pedrosoi CBS 271.37]KIW83754.1 hypothetical protein Z517_03000 [Fonsecaea pedrosoi CBS 271.37]
MNTHSHAKANDFLSGVSLSVPTLALAWGWPTAVVVGLTLTVLVLIWAAYRTNYPRIANIPEAPGSLPFVGHLPFLGGRLGVNDADIFSRWSRQLASGIYQIKLGYQRTVIVSSWAVMEELFVSKNSSMLDRVHQHGFSDYIGLDISGSSLTPDVKKCRAAAVRALGKSMWPRYYKLIEPDSVQFITKIYQSGKNGQVPLETYPWLRQIMFNLALHMTYGIRVGDFDPELATKLLNSLNVITECRGSTTEYRHYVPLLRMWPWSKSKLIAAAQERNRCAKVLHEQYRRKAEQGKAPDCLVSSMRSERLTPDELFGTCMSILQAAPDTVSSSTYQCMAWLSSAPGQAFQEECLENILEVYDGDRDRAWDMAFQEEKVPLLVSLYKETLRFYATSAFNMRRTSREVTVGDTTTLPKGVGVTMNIRGVNHDPDHYGPDALAFNPKRFLGDTSSHLPHLTFGTGSRICPAYMIANRIIYAMLVRLILAFRLKEVPGTRLPSIGRLDFSDVMGLIAVPRAYDCAFTARDDAWLKDKLAVE